MGLDSLEVGRSRGKPRSRVSCRLNSGAVPPDVLAPDYRDQEGRASSETSLDVFSKMPSLSAAQLRLYALVMVRSTSSPSCPPDSIFGFA